MKRRLMITIDVEAQPGRATEDHVRRLIWCDRPERRGGVLEMMDIADRHGVKLVMFHDHCEEFLYGEQMTEVARTIHGRGHDLQLHAHPEFLPASFWSERGLPRTKHIDAASDEQARAVIDFVCERHRAITGENPLSYRGGGYRYGPGVLRALAANGVRADLSYNADRMISQPIDLGMVGQFAWDNGVIEIPLSCVNPFLNLTRPFSLNFSSKVFKSADRMIKCLDTFHDQAGEDAVAVMIMHSWSFCERDEAGYFQAPKQEALDRFDAFLKAAVKQATIIDSKGLVDLADGGELRLGETRRLTDLASAQAARLATAS